MSVSGVIRNGPFSPAVTGALLYALTKSPEKYRQRLLDTLSRFLSAKGIQRVITALKWLCALGIARNLHIWLSIIAQNNFRLSSERQRYNWPNEVAVVTGAASGFGALTAKQLASHGINVMAVDVRDELPDDMKVRPRIVYHRCDITDREAVMALAQKIRTQYGDPSILINNAGVYYRHSILDIPEESLTKTFHVNIIAHYWTLQAFLPAMIANRKGHVVSLASMAAFLTAPGMVPYCNTKHAVLSLHEGLRQELRMVHNAPEVLFTSVHPTYANTPMVAPFKHRLEGKAVIIDPNTVADAIVNQILSCRGAQILLAPDIWWLAGVKAWPHWLSQALIQTVEGKMQLHDKASE